MNNLIFRRCEQVDTCIRIKDKSSNILETNQEIDLECVFLFNLAQMT